MEISEVERRQRLVKAIENLDVSANTLDLLLPSGRALDEEKELWDYKFRNPDWGRLREAAKKIEVQVEIAELVKDIVSFHNAHGGYIIFGVSDSPKNLVGVSGKFDTDDLKSQLEKYTGKLIEFSYREHSIADVMVGILCIAKRPYDVQAVGFIKDAKPNERGKRAFNKNDFYFRRRWRCIKASGVEDFSFLIKPGARDLDQFNASIPSVGMLLNNLGPRDPGMIKFVGRDKDLANLSMWMLDFHSNVRALIGVVGLGKTAIARRFADLLISSPPPGYEKLIWLSAKKRFFISVAGRSRDNDLIDFDDTESCLRQMLVELGCPDSAYDDDSDVSELQKVVTEQLKFLSCIIVIDDIDSLVASEQNVLFTTLQRIAAVNLATCHGPPTKFLVTSRLDLGGSPAETLHVRGLEWSDFRDYITVVLGHLQTAGAAQLSTDQLRRLHKKSEGSPAFVNAILRLYNLGYSLEKCLSEWEGSEGEAVRRYAFERELEQLSSKAATVLYTAGLLDAPTIDSVREISGLNKNSVIDALGELRGFGLVVDESPNRDKPSSIGIAESVRLLLDVLQKKVARNIEIEKRVRERNTEIKKIGGARAIGYVVSEIVSAWKSDAPDKALDIAREAVRTNPGNDTLLAMLGRCLLKVKPPELEQANQYLSRAVELGNKREEVLVDLINTRIAIADWRGLDGLLKKYDRLLDSASRAYYRAFLDAKVAENRQREGRSLEASAKYISAGRVISEAFDAKEAYGRVQELQRLQKVCFWNAIDVLQRSALTYEGRMKVWRAAVEISFFKGCPKEVVRCGVFNLEEALDAAEKKVAKAELFELFRSSSEALGEMIENLRRNQAHDVELVEALSEKIRADLLRLESSSHSMSEGV